MGERRNRKLFWDTKDDTKPMSGMREHDSWAEKDHHSSHCSGRFDDFPDSRTTSTRDSRDHSGWPSWEPIEEHPIAPMGKNFKSTYEANEMSGGKRYHKNISPGLEEMDLHSYNHTQEYDRSHSQRYMGKVMSRSRSGSRTRRRSRSRSLSKGRGREREMYRDRGRGRGWSRSRSRSRSRSNAYGYTIDYRRSHSPLGDYRRQSHGWSDIRSVPEKSSQTCRDFASGWCRKGSQCRFFHPTSLSCRDGDLVEDDRVESGRSRSYHSQIQKHSYTRLGFESRNDVSDLYHGEDEQYLHRSRNRSSIPCRDFKQGYCRWGDSCRYSHDAASADSFGRDTRNSTFGKEESDHRHHKRGKPLCKFFAAGNCNRDNCRFSHDDPNLNNLEGRLDKVTESQRSHDKGNWWDAPKWDDATRISDAPMSPGWGEAIATNTTSSRDATNGQSDDNWWNAPKWDDATRISDTPMSTGWGEAIATNTTSSRSHDATNGQGDDRWGLNSKNANKWGIQDWTSNSLDSERHPSLLRESGSYGGDTGPAKSIVVDHMPNKKEHLIFHDLQLRNKDRIANLHGLSALEENQSLTVEAMQQNVPPASHIQQQHFELVKSNPMTAFGSSVLDKVKETRYANNPVLLSGEGFNQNGTSMFSGNSAVLNESDRAQNMLYTNLSIGHDTDLKQPETHTINPLNEQIHVLNDKKTILSPRLLESQVPQILTNLLTSISNSPVTNASQQASAVKDPVSLIQSFVNDRSLTYAGIDVSSSRGTLPSISSITGSLPLVSTSGVQDNVHVASLDQFKSVGNNKEYIEPSSYNLAQGTDQNNEMQLRRSSLSPVGSRRVESPKLKHPESPRQQVEVVVDVGVTGDSKATGDASKEVQDRPSEDGQGKLEESSSANKDDKGLRLFKNSLVEFVKEILKPTWKEGHMSREVHKNVVKKVVDKVSSTIQVDHIPKTQDKIDQYLSLSKPKITQLVQAYVERCRKTDT